MNVRTVNLMGQAALKPNAPLYRPEFEDGFDYCLDAPTLIPSGSTAHMFTHDDGTAYNIATNTLRGRS